MGIVETVKAIAREEGMLEGMAKGKLEGEHDKAAAIAREMKKDGLPTVQIARLTKLSVKEIEQL